MTGIYGVAMVDKGMIHIPSWMEQEGMRFHHIIQNCTQVYKYFWNFPFNITVNGSWVNETEESETMGNWWRGELLHYFFLLLVLDQNR